MCSGDLEEAAAGDTSESIEALLRCIARLPERLRRVVRAGLDGDKPADLAEELVTSIGADLQFALPGQPITPRLRAEGAG